MPLKLLTCVDFLATVYLVPVSRVFQALVVQTSEYQIPTAISTACLWNWKAFPWAKSVCTAIQEKKVNGSPRKLALLWARSDSRTICRLFENRTGNAHQPSRRSLPDATGLQRWWRDVFFLPPLLYRLMPIFNFVAVFPWIFLLWQFVYTLVCSLSLLCSSVFYIVNMYNCLSFVLWKKKFFCDHDASAGIFLSLFQWRQFGLSLRQAVNFICHMDFFFFNYAGYFAVHHAWVLGCLAIIAYHGASFLFPYKIRPEFVTHWRCYVRFSFRLSRSPRVS